MGKPLYRIRLSSSSVIHLAYHSNQAGYYLTLCRRATHENNIVAMFAKVTCKQCLRRVEEKQG